MSEILKKQIKEIILNSEDFKDLIGKKSIDVLKKECYEKIIDIKNILEKDALSDNEIDKLIGDIASLMNSLKQLKNYLGKELKS